MEKWIYLFPPRNIDCSQHKNKFYTHLSKYPTRKTIFRNRPNSQGDTNKYSYKIDGQEDILLFYCNKEIIIYLFDKAPPKNYTKEWKHLVRSSQTKMSKASKESLTRNHTNNPLSKYPEIKGYNSPNPIHQ